MSNDVSFTVRDTPDVQTVRMINRKKTGQVEIRKYDGDGKTLVGAQWKIYRSDDTEVKFYRVSEGMYSYTENGSYTTLSTVNVTLTAMSLLATDVSTDNQMVSILSHYDEILDFDGGVMGYVEIPSIHVRLPIYHGESDDVLTKGAAHLEHTSFPIGGENTHACISAHSGYPTQKFFDDIDEMKSGDEIYIYVLNRTMKYTVTDKDVVEPDDSSKLEVVQGKDLLTLVTCTPYGINSHRLLIHAERVPFAVATHDSAATISQLTESNYYSSQLQIVIAGFVVIAVVIVKIYYWRRKRKRIRQQTEVTK